MCRWPELRTGQQHSSILSASEAPPPLALDPQHSRFAVADNEGITAIEIEINSYPSV